MLLIVIEILNSFQVLVYSNTYQMSHIEITE